jgi:beta-lactamase superfamily II metal-dependent hydrolase
MTHWTPEQQGSSSCGVDDFRRGWQDPLTMRSALLLSALLLTAGTATPRAAADPSGLRFTFVDVEGGAATLIVTPAGESILIDSGNPGTRDAGRIVAAAQQAGVTEISHYITTHWHSDHFGGIAEVAKAIPVRAVYGHTIPEPLPKDINADLVAAWKALSATPVFLEAGDEIELKGRRGTPRPKLRVLAANGLVLGEKPGAPPITTCANGHEAQPEDTSDNARSLALHLNYGKFDLFAGGDLTWNIEHKLTCPKTLAPKVDVYLVNHHGLDTSNHPALIDALAPEVAIVNSGPRKGAEPRTMAYLTKKLRDVGVFQIHRNVRPGAVNAEPSRVANDGEACTAQPLHLRVEPDGTRYTVHVPSRAADRIFSAN